MQISYVRSDTQIAIIFLIIFYYEVNISIDYTVFGACAL